MDANPGSELPEHALANRARWDEDAPNWVAAGERSWAAREACWGMWQVPESTVGMLPADMSGMHAIELGCGTGYVSAWMTRRGATVTAIDNSERQLETARRLAHEHRLDITWIHGNAEQVPRPGGSYDFAISEYGAAIWCDPFAWIPEAHRLLRAGGVLAFLGSHPLALACTPLDGSPTSDTLVRDWFALHRIDWRHVAFDPGGIEFTLPTGGWFRLFDRVGFDVIDYQELQAPDAAAGKPFGTPAEWAHRFPSEHVWRVRKRG
ncbi:MAG TPA: methyltransferase domain-containing protein [Caldimonas sp.]|nr:methyltransferase domain-containing protein [Caldimonas sp.]